MKSRRYLDVLKTVRYLVCGIGAALMVMTVAACGSNDSAENSAPAATETPPPTVKVMLNLMPQVQYIGIHAAEGQGYYQDKDLDVELLYSDPNADIIAAVTTGGAQFGVVSADRVLQARSRGEPVVAVMALYQRDPTAVLSLQTKEIRQASDLIGKKVLLWNESVSFQMFIQTVGIDANQVTLVYPEGDSIIANAMPFLTGQVDAMVVPGTDVMVQLQSLGFQTNSLFLDDYGVANYPNVVVTTEQMIRGQPQVIQDFVNATLLGLQYAVDQPQAAAASFIDYYSDRLLPQQLGSQEEALLAVLPLLRPAGSEPGMMTRDTWQYIYDGLVALDMLDPTVDFSKAYTLQFVEDYYARLSG